MSHRHAARTVARETAKTVASVEGAVSTVLVLAGAVASLAVYGPALTAVVVLAGLLVAVSVGSTRAIAAARAEQATFDRQALDGYMAELAAWPDAVAREEARQAAEQAGRREEHRIRYRPENLRRLATHLEAGEPLLERIATCEAYTWSPAEPRVTDKAELDAWIKSGFDLIDDVFPERKGTWGLSWSYDGGVAGSYERAKAAACLERLPEWRSAVEAERP